VLFSCDGTIYDMNGYPRIEFTVASERLARDCSTALLRSASWPSSGRRPRTPGVSSLTAPEEVSRYQRSSVGSARRSTRFPAEKFDHAGTHRHACAGAAPRETWDLVRASTRRAGLTLSDLARRTGERTESGYNAHTGARHPARAPRALRRGTGRPELQRVASEDLYWDEIIEITPVGEMQVYDLNVPAGSNFIANDICVHNTSAAMNMAENAAIRANIPVAVFSVEMSKEQLRCACCARRAKCRCTRCARLPRQRGLAAALTTGAGLAAEGADHDRRLARAIRCSRSGEVPALEGRGKLGLVVIDYLSSCAAARRPRTACRRSRRSRAA
jgi:replicative DNA helicase